MTPEIELGVIIEFDFSEFVIRYDADSKTWYAEHFDEETYPDDILIEDELFIDGKLPLFGEFILTKDKFEEFKLIVSKENK